MSCIAKDKYIYKEESHFKKIKAEMQACTVVIRKPREKFLPVVSFNREGAHQVGRAVQSQTKNEQRQGVKEHGGAEHWLKFSDTAIWDVQGRRAMGHKTGEAFPV